MDNWPGEKFLKPKAISAEASAESNETHEMSVNGARYSTLSSPVHGAWIAERLTSNWLLRHCCDCCRPWRKSSRGSASATCTNDSGEPDKREVVASIETTRSRNGVELALDEVPLTKRDYGVLRDDAITARDASGIEEAAASPMTNRDAVSAIDVATNLGSRSSRGDIAPNGTKRAIGVLPRKERKLQSIEENSSSEEYPPSIFAKCSRRREQRKPINIPELIISPPRGDSHD